MDHPTECNIDSPKIHAETGASQTPLGSTSVIYQHILLELHRIWWPDVNIPTSLERLPPILINKSRFYTKTLNHQCPPIIVCTLHELSQVLSIFRVVKIATQWDLAYLKKSDLLTSSQAINIPYQYFERVTKRFRRLSAFNDDDLDPDHIHRKHDHLLTLRK